MPGEAINIGRIFADLDVNSGNMVEGLTKGQAALDRIMAELKQLDGQLKSGAIGFDAYVKRAAELSSVAGEISGRMQEANAALASGTSAVDLLNQKLEASGRAGSAAADGIRNLEAEIAEATGKIYAMADSYGVLSHASAAAFRQGHAAAPETVEADRQSKIEALRQEFAESDRLAEESHRRQQAIAEEAYQKELAAAVAVSNQIQAGFERQYQAAEEAYQKERAAAEETARAMIAAFSAMEQHKAGEARAAVLNRQALASAAAAEEQTYLNDIIKLGTRDMYGYSVATSMASTATVDLGGHAIPEAVRAMYQEAAAAKAAADAMAASAAKTQTLGRQQQVVSGSMQQSTHAANRFSMGLMQVGYIIDDLQYGFSAVVNNIAPLIHGLGGSAGIAVAAQIAGVAAYQLYNNFDKLNELFGNAKNIDTAKMSIRELDEVVKKLSDDLENFSLGERFSSFLGFDPNRGKAQLLEVEQENLKRRKKAVAAADQAADFERPETKEEKERFIQAVGESQKSIKEKGYKDVTDKLAESMLRGHLQRGGDLAHFLKKDDWLKDPMGDRISGSESSSMQYHRLRTKQIGGQKLSDEELSTLNSLKAEAHSELRRQAHEFLGAAAGDTDKAQVIGEMVGGEEGKVISGAKATEKERQESEKEALAKKQKDQDDFERRMKAESAVEKEGQKANQAAAETIFPQLKHQADRAQLRVDQGAVSRDEALQRLQGMLVEKGMGGEDAAEAARRALSEAGKTGEDPVKREARLKKESMSKAEEIIPDVSDTVESAIARGIDPKKITGGIEEKLKKGGMGSTEATETAGILLGKGQESVRERLANLATGQRPEDLRSEVSATSQLTQKVQSGVGAGSETKKTNDLLEKQRVLLEKIANKSAVQLELK